MYYPQIPGEAQQQQGNQQTQQHQQQQQHQQVYQGQVVVNASLLPQQQPSPQMQQQMFQMQQQQMAYTQHQHQQQVPFQNYPPPPSDCCNSSTNNNNNNFYPPQQQQEQKQNHVYPEVEATIIEEHQIHTASPIISGASASASASAATSFGSGAISYSQIESSSSSKKMPNPLPTSHVISGGDIENQQLTNAVLQDVEVRTSKLEICHGNDLFIRNAIIIDGAYKDCTFKSCKLFNVKHCYGCSLEDTECDYLCVVTEPKKTVRSVIPK